MVTPRYAARCRDAAVTRAAVRVLPRAARRSQKAGIAAWARGACERARSTRARRAMLRACGARSAQRLPLRCQRARLRCWCRDIHAACLRCCRASRMMLLTRARWWCYAPRHDDAARSDADGAPCCHENDIFHAMARCSFSFFLSFLSLSPLDIIFFRLSFHFHFRWYYFSFIFRYYFIFSLFRHYYCFLSFTTYYVISFSGYFFFITLSITLDIITLSDILIISPLRFRYFDWFSTLDTFHYFRYYYFRWYFLSFDIILLFIDTFIDYLIE